MQFLIECTNLILRDLQFLLQLGTLLDPPDIFEILSSVFIRGNGIPGLLEFPSECFEHALEATDFG